MDFITEDMRLAVKRGSHWMDTNYPGWERNIDLGKLDMNKCDVCIIGQAAMDQGYWRVVDRGAIKSGYGSEMTDWSIDYGFDAEGRDLSPEEWHDYDNNDLSDEAKSRYFGLETLWTEEVYKRLG